MTLFAIGFLLGDILLHHLAKLPPWRWIILFIILFLLLFFLLRRWRKKLYLLLAIFLGFAWTSWYAQHLLFPSLPPTWEGQQVQVVGYIASLPAASKWGVTFLLQSKQIEKSEQKIFLPGYIQLSWSHPGSLHVGEKWLFNVRLKRIHGKQNPGSMDYEAIALQKGIRATGTVLAKAQLLSASSYHYFFTQLREKLQQKLLMHLPKSHTAHWLPALTTGERHAIPAEQWQILRNTGTNHLMAIAGLHIGLMSGFAYTLVAWLWRRSARLTLLLPAPIAGSCAALSMGLFYSTLAGYSLPTQRAAIMLSIFILTLLCRRFIHAWHSWSLALILVLLINPLCVLTESFWLSFGTIALIIYGMSGRLAPQGWWWKWGRVQWVIGIGLIPFSLALFQQCSLISFLANSIAIPWLGFLILPFCFLGSLLLIPWPAAGAGLLWIADRSLAGLWALLSWFSSLPMATVYQAMPNHFILFVTLIGIIVLLLPAGFPGRWLGLCCFLSLWSHTPERPAKGEVWLSVLDVGQALALVVETHTHFLVFDTGAKQGSSDDGESIVLPYLRTRGIYKLDKLVLSHGDNDHAGGATAILQGIPVARVESSVPQKFSTQAYLCLSGMQWEWDGVRFSYLNPAADQLQLGNNSSCVLRIDNGHQRILLTGDIEKIAEKELVARQRTLLPADILVAPHHGSQTSALPAFVQNVSPRYVIYSTGYRNRYHFPHPSVVKTYAKLGSTAFNTTDTGGIVFKLKPTDQPILVERYRYEHARYWFDKPQ